MFLKRLSHDFVRSSFPNIFGEVNSGQELRLDLHILSRDLSDAVIDKYFGTDAVY
jgi:hypothetical protein